MSKVNFVFLHGFQTELGATDAVHLTVEGDTLTLRKGPALDGWLTDASKIILSDGETTVCAENMRRLQAMVSQWMRGEDLDG